MLGQKIRELREARGLVQREIAAILEVDTAYVSKMESNEKPVSRHHLKKLSQLLEVREEELHTLWVADRVYNVVKGEKVAVNAIHLAESHLLKSKIPAKKG
jgi:transcriptional regulator with XRE-family HTH domain